MMLNNCAVCNKIIALTIYKKDIYGEFSVYSVTSGVKTYSFCPECTKKAKALIDNLVAEGKHYREINKMLDSELIGNERTDNN